MVALIDTDVLIDALVRREPFDKEAREIFLLYPQAIF
jgi:predicted nucleic acid-binding protein